MPPIVTRKSHPTARRRLLVVRRVTDLTPRLRRVTLTGDLEQFQTAAPDDHVKVFFLGPDQHPDDLLLGGQGTQMRDYTPRRHDPVARELDLDFVLHGEGVGSTWAAQVQPGDPLVIGGPRASLLVSRDFELYLLVGDESALPAISRRLEDLPSGARARVILEVDGPGDELTLSTCACAEVTWLHRNGVAPGTSDLLERAVRSLTLPKGHVFAWVGCEQRVAGRLRRHLLEDRGFPHGWVRATGYWKLRTAAGEP